MTVFRGGGNLSETPQREPDSPLGKYNGLNHVWEGRRSPLLSSRRFAKGDKPSSQQISGAAFHPGPAQLQSRVPPPSSRATGEGSRATFHPQPQSRVTSKRAGPQHPNSRDPAPGPSTPPAPHESECRVLPIKPRGLPEPRATIPPGVSFEERTPVPALGKDVTSWLNVKRKTRISI